jgi:hypothetical protein
MAGQSRSAESEKQQIKAGPDLHRICCFAALLLCCFAAFRCSTYPAKSTAPTTTTPASTTPRREYVPACDSVFPTCLTIPSMCAISVIVALRRLAASCDTRTTNARNVAAAAESLPRTASGVHLARSLSVTLSTGVLASVANARTLRAINSRLR